MNNYTSPFVVNEACAQYGGRRSLRKGHSAESGVQVYYDTMHLVGG